MSAKLKRQLLIKEILNNESIGNQELLGKILKNNGIEVTQATLSRDFAELGVVRSFTESGVRYVLNSTESGKQIQKLIGFEILSVTSNEQVVLVRTLAGRAPGVAHYIDRLNRKEILGTLAGDDTVLIIPDSIANINRVERMIKEMMYQPPVPENYQEI